MNTILVDTSVYSRAMAGGVEEATVLRGADRILVCPIVLGELLDGFARGKHAARNREVLGQFLAAVRVQVVPITPDTSEFYARIVGALRQAGRPIPTNDIWIAACAMEHGAALATRDRHFALVPGLITC